jgi:hypothetical protein
MAKQPVPKSKKPDPFAPPVLPEPPTDAKLVGTTPCATPGCHVTDVPVYDYGNGKYVALHHGRRIPKKTHTASFGKYYLSKVTPK